MKKIAITITSILFLYTFLFSLFCNRVTTTNKETNKNAINNENNDDVEFYLRREYSSEVKSVSISPDGKTIVSAGWDKTVKIWDRETGELLHSFEVPSPDVISVSISPDGKTIVSAGWDETITMWDLETGKLIRSQKREVIYRGPLTKRNI